MERVGVKGLATVGVTLDRIKKVRVEQGVCSRREGKKWGYEWEMGVIS